MLGLDDPSILVASEFSRLNLQLSLTHSSIPNTPSDSRGHIHWRGPQTPREAEQRY